MGLFTGSSFSTFRGADAIWEEACVPKGTSPTLKSGAPLGSEERKNKGSYNLVINSLLPVKSELPLDGIGRRRVKALQSFSVFEVGRPFLLRPGNEGKFMLK